MPVDLHVHSDASDGVDSPSALIALASEAGLSTVALTDHDTFAGLDEACSAAEELGIGFIPGVELSVDHDGSKMHMLVYFVDNRHRELAKRLSELRQGRNERNVLIVEKLNEMAYEITLDDVQAHALGPSVGRPHIADALVEKGYFVSRDAAFADLLHDGGPGYASRPRLSATEAITLGREVGGVSVIAHPATIAGTADRYDDVFRELTDVGLGGIEAYHSMHSPDLRRHLARVAASLGIAATGGSDYHGADKRDYHIGVGTGDLRVPESAVDQLEAQRNR